MRPEMIFLNNHKSVNANIIIISISYLLIF